MTNQYGLDADYFKLKLRLVVRNINSYTPAELARELGRLASTADKSALLEDINIFKQLRELPTEVMVIAEQASSDCLDARLNAKYDTPESYEARPSEKYQPLPTRAALNALLDYLGNPYAK